MIGSNRGSIRTAGVLLVVMAIAAGACRTAPTGTGSTTTLATTTTAAVDGRRPVIFDYSPTVSDMGALTFLASHPDLRLVAVTLPGTGESYCEPGIAHTRGVLVELGLGDVPVACGPDRPFGRYNSFPIMWRLGVNGLDLPEAEPNETRTAPELINALLESTATPIEIVAVGPLTNLATAFEARPDLINRVAGITIMGGAVDVPGNVFRNPYGEWNIWVDPTAADFVFASGAPITLVPLDATNFVPTSPVFYESLISEPASVGSSLVGGMWTASSVWIETANGYFLWDELAAAVLVDESIVTFDMRNLVVDDDNFENEGWTREDPAGSPVRVAISADRLAFERLFLSTVLGRVVELGYLEATAEELTYFNAVAAINVETSLAADGILEESAVELGLPDEFSDEDFLTLFGLALPRLFAGPLTDQATQLEALTAPDRLEEAHVTLVAANRLLVDSTDEVLAAFAAEPGFASLGAYLAPFVEACATVQYEVGLRLLDLDLTCLEG